MVYEFEGEVIIIIGAESDSELVAEGGAEHNLSDIELGYSHVVVIGRIPLLFRRHRLQNILGLHESKKLS